MEQIKNFIKEVNDTIDTYLPNVPNWIIWAAVIYLILK